MHELTTKEVNRMSKISRRHFVGSTGAGLAAAAAVPLRQPVAEDACPDERVDVEVDHVGRVAKGHRFARDVSPVAQRPGSSQASPPVHSASSVNRFDTDHVRPKVQK